MERGAMTYSLFISDIHLFRRLIYNHIHGKQKHTRKYRSSL